ncbi:winged helix-turn-helix transcriptional regulator [Candidatus Dojkabacteria bacterium]|nr:winged helix-turn-helix transcriptional regulator [Candidatus Dojkabacteria bacterium]
MNFEISPAILQAVAKIHTLQERFQTLPIEQSWLKQLQEDSIIADTIATYKLDGGKIEVDSMKQILGVKSLKDRQILLNEYEIRKSFPLYFKSKELRVEDIHYVHRLLDNLQDETANERGNLRKEQEVLDAEILPGLLELIPRYGFLRREMEDICLNINENELHFLLVAGLIHLDIVRLSPYLRSNFRVARVVSRGFLYANGFDINQILSVDEVFSQNIEKYLKELKAGIEGDNTGWLEYFLQAILDSYKLLSKKIEKISGGSIKPLEKEVIPLTKRQRTIVELLKKNSQMSGSEIAVILGVTRQNIHVIMQKLLRKKMAERLGRGTASRYRLKAS